MKYLSTFFVFFFFRYFFIKRKLSIFVYHIILFCILSIASVVGISVQKDGYTRLEKFIELEEKNKLDNAKQNLQNYDSMLRIDLLEFKNSDEFRVYLKRHDHAIDKAENIFIGYLFVLVSDLALLSIYILRRIVIATNARQDH